MREIKIVTTSCDNCKLKNTFFECNLLDLDVEDYCHRAEFHPDCPMVEVKEV